MSHYYFKNHPSVNINSSNLKFNHTMALDLRFASLKSLCSLVLPYLYCNHYRVYGLKA